MEKINLTGGQIQDVMDTLLYQALEPVIRHTNLFDSQLVLVLSFITQNKKRKVSSLDRTEAIELLCRIMHEDEPEAKVKLIRSLYLERGFVHQFLRNFLEDTREYVRLTTLFLRARDKEVRDFYRTKLNAKVQEYGLTSRSSLYQAVTQCQEALRRFYDYFNSIVQEYMKLCSKMASDHVDANPGSNYDFYDVRQNFIQKVIVALNKYNAGNGALTTYIGWWIYNAKTSCSSDYEYGLAYVIPQTKRRSLASGSDGEVNFSESLDSMLSDEDSSGLHERLASTENIELIVYNRELLDSIKSIAKTVDPTGVGRLSLDIGESFSERELMLMQKHMTDNNL